MSSQAKQMKFVGRKTSILSEVLLQLIEKSTAGGPVNYNVAVISSHCNRHLYS